VLLHLFPAVITSILIFLLGSYSVLLLASPFFNDKGLYKLERFSCLYFPFGVTFSYCLFDYLFCL
jgi:hypothetical protein